jgi:hypothetical protein
MNLYPECYCLFDPPTEILFNGAVPEPIAGSLPGTGHTRFTILETCFPPGGNNLLVNQREKYHMGPLICCGRGGR